MKVRLTISSLIFFVLFGVTQVSAQTNPLKIEADDVYVEPHADGFHLFIRKKAGLESVMLTESFELPNKSIDSYSLKGFARNDINGNEKRLLNGKFLNNNKQFFLIDSTPESNVRLGEAFHILIPTRIEYGYKDSTNRYGVHNLLQYKEEGKPYWFSIRAFSKSYQDYSGNYLDNAYELFISDQDQVQQSAVTSDEKGFYTGLQDSFSRFSNPVVSQGGRDLPTDLSNLIDNAVKDMSKGSLDIAIVFDTTRSMSQHLTTVKQFFMRVIEDSAREFAPIRVGFVFFKDYMEEYLTKTVDFQNNFAVVNSQIQNVTAGGGGDFPEAVYEGIYAALTQLAWQGQNRLVIVIGDAPPHEIPRGDVTEEMVLNTAREEGISIYSIMLPFERK